MKLEFTERDLAILSTALGAMPYRDVAPLVAAINRQIEQQQKSSQPPLEKPSTEWAEQMNEPGA